ncbi:hypothetical protein XELAEV_18001722mg [Xenopus laevis]|nr:hypothetical protein XELAEV_18001722mg [Xenopus laevis]
MLRSNLDQMVMNLILFMELWDRLLSRDYETENIKQAYEKAILWNRTELLATSKKTKDKKGMNRMRLVCITLHPVFSTMDLKKPQTVYGRNMKKQTSYNWMTVFGTFKCGATVCKCCGFIKKSNQFQSTSTQKIYKNRERHKMLFTLLHCGQQYVGKTTRKLKDRVLEHAEHVIINDNANEQYMTFQVIEIVKLGKRKGDIDKLLTIREFNWILALDTVKPRGLKRECDIKHYIRG